MAAPTRRRRPDLDEEEDTTPRRRRVRDEEEDTTPRRRRVRDEDQEDEDFDEPPHTRRAARSRAEDVEDDEAPRRRRPASRGPEGRAGRRPGNSRPSGRVASGWGGYNKVKSASSDFEKKFKPSNQGSIAMLLEPEPFAAFARHWVELADGKRAFICPASLEVDEDDEVPECPLCDVGDKPNGAKAYINVACLTPGERPELQVWEIGGSISDQLQTIDKSIGRKTALTDIYILATSSGTGLNTKYQLEPLFEDDLDEFEVKPLTEKQITSFELYDASLYEVPSLAELNKAADEIA